MNGPAPRAQTWRAGFSHPFASSSGASVVWVSINGSDAHCGSSDQPFATIAHAVAATASRPSPRLVLLLTGVHYISSTITLLPQNSNTSISSAPGHDALVSGGVAFEAEWETAGVTSAGDDILRTPAPHGLAEALELFDGELSTRYVPARHPNGDPEQDQSNYQAKASGWLAPVQFGNVTVVSNDSFKGNYSFGTYSVGVGGPADFFDPPVSYWAQPHPSGGGASQYSMVQGMLVKNSTVPVAPRPGGYVFMMQPGSWGSWVFDIMAVAPTHNTSSEPTNTITFGAGGFQEARGTGGPRKGGGQFYISHRKELLDAPGEFWHDADAAVVYLVAAKSAPTSTTSARNVPRSLVIPTVAELFKLSGSKDNPVTNVRISALTMRQTSPTYMRKYTVPSGGDYAVYRGGAVHLNGTVNCSVDHNLMDKLGGNCIWLTDYNRYLSPIYVLLLPLVWLFPLKKGSMGPHGANAGIPVSRMVSRLQQGGSNHSQRT